MDDPFVITMPAQLDEVRNNLAANYILGNDIDMDGIDFQPIGTKSKFFNGCFNGNGYKISNLTIRSDVRYVGLFTGINNGVVKNLGLENADIAGTLQEVGAQQVGGIAAYSTGITIERCYVEGTLSGTNVGGIIYLGKYNVIRECYTAGSFITTYSDVCGIGAADTGTLIINCYSSADLYGTAAGISTRSDPEGQIQNCYYSGNIENSFDAVGVSARCTITGCAAVGTSITAYSPPGSGRISQGTLGVLSNNIGYDNMLAVIQDKGINFRTLSPTHDSIHGENRTLAQLKQQATYEDLGWDFDNVWAIDEGQSFPYLQCFSNGGGGGGTNPGNGDSDLGLVAFDYVASTEDTVTLKWENLPGAEYYEVEYNGTIETVYTNELMVHGLTPDTATGYAPSMARWSTP